MRGLNVCAAEFAYPCKVRFTKRRIAHHADANRGIKVAFCQSLSGLRRFPLVSGSDADALRVRSSIIFSARSCDIGRSLVRIASNRTVLSVSAVNSTRSPGFRPMAERIFAGIVTWPFFVNFVIVDTVPMARLIEQPKWRVADTRQFRGLIAV